jgi:uncharacterized protein (TIGR00725 family)
MHAKPVIAVIGGRKVEKRLLQEAEEVGSFIAHRDAILVSGGLGGVMEAASRGAKKAGGVVVGILPHEHKREMNQYIDVPVATGLGIGRNTLRDCLCTPDEKTCCWYKNMGYQRDHSC